MALEDLLGRGDLPEDVREAIREAKEKLQEREDTLRALLNATSESAMLVDLEGTILAANEVAAQRLGTRAEKLIGLGMYDYLPPDLATSRKAQGDEIVRSGKPVRFQDERAGRCFDNSLYPVVGADGRVAAFAVYARDVTEARQAEKALAESEERFRSLISEMVNGFALHEIICDDAGEPCDYRFLAVNHAFERMVGLSAADVVGKTVLEVLPDTEEHWIKVYGQVALTTESTRLEEYSAAVQKHFEVLAYSPTKGQFATVFTDITERKRAEEALRVSEERLRVATDHLDGVLWALDTELRFTLSKGRGLAALGLEPDQVVGMSLSDFLKTTDPDHPTIAQHRRALAGETVELETSYGGTTFSSVVSPMKNQKGDTVGIVAVALDVTQRRREEQERRSLEAQVQHGQRLESLGVLAGGVAHDFNNLLVGMLGHSDMALHKLSPESPARSNIEQVMQAAQRATDLSRQMLAYSGHGHLVVKTTDLSALVRENVHLLKAGIAKGVRLRAELTEAPAYVEADVGQIQQVIMNLVINAAEAIGDRSGYVTISTGFEELSGEEARYSRFTATELEAGRYVFLEVRDDGPGMDEETLSKVFDPFFTTKFVGRGLGLSALLGIVRGHNGGIDVQSEAAKGTTFRLVFPVAQEPPEATKVVAAEGSLESTILVIDDEEIVREMVSEMLTPQGMTVLTAGGGEAGVALYKERRGEIGLVLLDCSMPEMSGDETFKELRKISPDVPVLLSSGFGQEEATRRFGDQALTGFIQKPYRLATLLGEVRRCLGQG